MSSTSHYVSFIVMGDETGSNMLGHTCLLLSTQNQDGIVEAKSSYGFYSQNSEKGKDTLFYKAKKALGFDFPIAGVFGKMSLEECRYLDKNGLRGKTFAISEKQYHQLEKRILERQQKVDEEASRIKAILKAKNLDTDVATIYEYAVEEANGQIPEILKPFQFTLSPFRGTKESINCKTVAIDLLRDIGISEKELAILTGTKWKSGVPRFSGGLSDILLFNDGPVLMHESKRSGFRYRFRQWGQDKDNSQVYWAMPIENLNMPERLQDLLKSYIQYLHRLEAKIIYVKDKKDNEMLVDDKDIEFITNAYKKLFHLQKDYQATKSYQQNLQQELTAIKDFCDKKGPIFYDAQGATFRFVCKSIAYISLALSVGFVALALLAMSGPMGWGITLGVATAALVTSGVGFFQAYQPQNPHLLRTPDSPNLFVRAC